MTLNCFWGVYCWILVNFSTYSAKMFLFSLHSYLTALLIVILQPVNFHYMLELANNNSIYFFIWCTKSGYGLWFTFSSTCQIANFFCTIPQTLSSDFIVDSLVEALQKCDPTYRWMLLLRLCNIRYKYA